MKHETPTIAATLRDRLGSRYAQRLRKIGRMPAVIYGHKTDPVAISVDEKEVLALLRHGAHVVNVAIEGQQPETCLVKELQFGYLGDNVIHIDFARVNLSEEVHVNVHLRFVGEPAAAKQAGAVLTHPMTELEVICKVADIPDEIKVDLTKMVDDVLTVGDIQLPPNVRTAVPVSEIVAQVTTVAEEVEAPEAAEVAGEAQPEVISESKKQEAEE